MGKTFGMIACLSGAVAVIAGAFGAHLLQPLLEQNQKLDTFLTASRYHIFHSLALLALAMMYGPTVRRTLTAAGWSFITGMVLFSGSLYLISLTGYSRLGILAPVGGLSLIAGWLLFALAFLKDK